MKRIFPIAAVSMLVAAALLMAWQQNAPKLPPPYATPGVENGPRVIAKPEDAKLNLPPGFRIEEYTDQFMTPRFMLLGPSGEVLVSDSTSAPDGSVQWLLDLNKDGKPDKRGVVAGRLDRPYGLAFWKDYLYIAEATSVKRYKYDPKSMTAGKGEEVVPMHQIGDGHWTRSLVFDRAGSKMYVGIGSRSNVAPGEPPERAAINRYNPDGSGHEIHATGTRNPIGLRFYPGTDTLWAAVQERDMLGDDLVPDYFTHVEQGGFYGWPFAYIGPNEDPRNKGLKPDLVAKTIVPDVVLGAHVAVLDFLFYGGKQFPAEYRGGAFLALHGSWNRSQRVGYSVAFVPFKNAKPAGPVRDFLTGWMLAPDKKEVWGRPVAVLELPDGSILVSDDGGGKIWRITYKG